MLDVIFCVRASSIVKYLRLRFHSISGNESCCLQRHCKSPLTVRILALALALAPSPTLTSNSNCAGNEEMRRTAWRRLTAMLLGNHFLSILPCIMESIWGVNCQKCELSERRLLYREGDRCQILRNSALLNRTRKLATSATPIGFILTKFLRQNRPSPPRCATQNTALNRFNKSARNGQEVHWWNAFHAWNEFSPNDLWKVFSAFNSKWIRLRIPFSCDCYTNFLAGNTSS